MKDRPVSPADLAATVFEHLGFDPLLKYKDRFMQIRQQFCVGDPIQLV